MSKKTVLVEENQGVPDYEITKAARDIRIVCTYQSRDAVMRRTTSEERTQCCGSEESDPKFREDGLVPQRDIDRCMRREMCATSIWGGPMAIRENRRKEKASRQR